MKSLRNLVDIQNVTVVSAIHQPRKFIFDLFDSLLLLGVGGRVVYHGTTVKCIPYFRGLNYTMPIGESLADWLIDISSGRLDPDNVGESDEQDASERREWVETTTRLDRALPSSFDSLSGPGEKANVLGIEDKELHGEFQASGAATARTPEAVLDNERNVHSAFRDPVSVKPVNTLQSETRGRTTKLNEQESTDAPEFGGSEKAEELDRQELGAVALGRSKKVKGIKLTAGKLAQDFEEAKARRAWLYDEWIKHFQSLDDAEKSIYDAPERYPLPKRMLKPTFREQLVLQLRRAVLVAWRNRFTKVVDTMIIVGSVILISLIDGIEEVSLAGTDPDVSFETAVRPQKEDFAYIAFQNFRWANVRQIE